MKSFLAIDIGGSKICAAVVGEDGHMGPADRRELSGCESRTELIDIILSCARHAAAAADTTPDAAGVSVPGLTDSEKGIWVYSPFSGIRDVPIRDIISDSFGLRTGIENDVNASALAEREFGICAAVDDYIWITVSNGIGGAVMVNGRLYKGEHGNAGEIGHITVSDSQKRCGCGKYGCLEAMASGRGISDLYHDEFSDGIRMSAQKIAGLARSGEPAALGCYTQAGRYIGRAISEAAMLFDIDFFVIGGGVSRSFELLEDGIKEGIDRYSFRGAQPHITVKQTGLSDKAALLGAVCAAKICAQEEK